MFERIKPFITNDTTFYSVIITLVAGLAFGLGRLSVLPPPGQSEILPLRPVWEAGDIGTTSQTAMVPLSAKPAATTTIGPVVAPTLPASLESQFVASRKGTKYHYSWCPGASQIKDTNRLYFATAEAAKAAGYTPAANCPGLE